MDPLVWWTRIEGNTRELWILQENLPHRLTGNAHLRGTPAVHGSRICWVEEQADQARVRDYCDGKGRILDQTQRGHLLDPAVGGAGIAWTKFEDGSWDVVFQDGVSKTRYGEQKADDVVPVVGDTGIAWVQSHLMDVVVRATIPSRTEAITLPGTVVSNLVCRGDTLFWTSTRGPRSLAWICDADGPRHLTDDPASVDFLVDSLRGDPLPTVPKKSLAQGIWTRVYTKNKPYPRTTHATLQLDERRVLVFGGEIYDPVNSGKSLGLDNQTWVFDPGQKDWRQVDTPVELLPRCHTPMAYAPQQHKALLWGGATLNEDGRFRLLSDTWQFDTELMRWNQIQTENSPPPEADASLFFDSRGNRFLLYSRGDLWELSFPDKSWTRISAGPGPSPRASFSAAYDPINHRVLFFGGSNHPKYFDETWILDLSSYRWEEVVTRGHPSSRVRPALAYDSIAHRLVLYGGVRGPYSRRFEDLWEFDLEGQSQWRLIPPSGASPGPRGGFMGWAFDPSGNRFLLFGGRSGIIPHHNDTWWLEIR